MDVFSSRSFRNWELLFFCIIGKFFGIRKSSLYLFVAKIGKEFVENTKREGMNHTKGLLKMIVLSMLIALGVVISPILRVEGMCPMAHFINIVCSVFLGPWYSLLCATLIGVLRMILMGIPPLALTGAVFGAFLSGVFYRWSNGKLLYAVLGEIIGTGLIGAVVSYPVMTILWGKEGLSWLFYVPSFICGTLIGGGIAFVFLRKLAENGLLVKIQAMLDSRCYTEQGSVISNAAAIAAMGAIFFVVVEIATELLKCTSALWSYASYGALGVCVVFALLYLVCKRKKEAAS